MTTSKDGITSIVLHPVEKKLLKQLAKRTDMTRSAVVRLAIVKLAESMGMGGNAR